MDEKKTLVLYTEDFIIYYRIKLCISDVLHVDNILQAGIAPCSLNLKGPDCECNSIG